MFRLAEYNEKMFPEWNSFVERSNNGTIFHRLDFLEYHGDRFKEGVHNLVWLKGDEIIAVLPLYINLVNGRKKAVSPYGASFGGIVTGKCLNYSESCMIADTLIEHLKKASVEKVSVTLAPVIYDRIESETLRFALIERGFRIVSSDITSIVSLPGAGDNPGLFEAKEKELRRKAEKAERLGVHAEYNPPSEDFWRVVMATFNRHGVPPTHSYSEWCYLCSRFPESVRHRVAYIENLPVAGIGLIRLNKKADLAFYLCADQQYNNTQALTYLIYKSVLSAREEGLRWFDLGTSSVKMTGRENIFRFKESTGATGYFRHTMDMDL